MTTNGGAFTNGNVFRLTPSGMATNIYSFTGGTDGLWPQGELAPGTDGNFYGVTEYNYIQGFQFYGTIFKVSPGGALTTLYSLNGAEDITDGVRPLAGLLQGSDGNFYGTTFTGYSIFLNGTTYDSSHGTVFRITPGGEFNTMTALNGFDDGSHPESTLVEGPDGCLYGTTTTNGPGWQGTVFRIAFTGAPQILTQPVDQAEVPGASVSFNVTTFGAPPLFYQWQQNGTNLTDAGNVSGSAARVLTLTNITQSDAGTYSVIVSNALGSATSSGALLGVAQAPMFLSAGQTGGTFFFTWSATSGQIYQPQSATKLKPANWSNLGGPVPATNIVMGASDPISTNTHRFYRVQLLP